MPAPLKFRAAAISSRVVSAVTGRHVALPWFIYEVRSLIMFVVLVVYECLTVQSRTSTTSYSPGLGGNR